MAAPALRGWRALLAALVLGVAWLAFDPAPPRGADLGWDKLNHATAFACQALAACRAFPAARRARIALALLAYGAFIEAVQSLLPTRDAEVADILADAVGIGAGLLLDRAWRRAAAR